MTPIRVAVSLMILAGMFGFLVGKGANPAFLLILPIVAWWTIVANKGLRS